MLSNLLNLSFHDPASDPQVSSPILPQLLSPNQTCVTKTILDSEDLPINPRSFTTFPMSDSEITRLRREIEELTRAREAAEAREEQERREREQERRERGGRGTRGTRATREGGGRGTRETRATREGERQRHERNKSDARRNKSDARRSSSDTKTNRLRWMNTYGTATPSSIKASSSPTSLYLPRDLQKSTASSTRNGFVLGPSLPTLSANNSLTSSWTPVEVSDSSTKKAQPET